MTSRQICRGHAVVISSPSGGGKTTVVRQLLRRLPGLVRSVSVTTRSPRQGERHGRAYWFLSPARFAAMRRQGQLLEWARVHGAWYGTPKVPVQRAMARGRDAILSVDTQGARQVRRALGRRAVLVFLLPPSMAELRRRLRGRGTETTAQVARRLATARRELALAARYDYRVVNDDVRRAVQTLRGILLAHRRQSHEREEA